MITNEELWQSVLAQIQLTISPANFTTWFKGTNILSFRDGSITIATPNSFTKEWLEQKYSKQIFKILHNLTEGIKEVKYLTQKNDLKSLKRPEAFLPEIGQMEFQEFKADRETNLNPRYTFDNFVVGPFNELPQAAGWAVSQ